MSDDTERKDPAESGMNGDAHAAGDVGQAADQTDANATRTPPPADPETRRKLAAMRSRLREAFGGVVMAMMLLPRYRHLALYDLQHVVLDPLVNDRIAMAHPRDRDGKPLKDLIGLAIWASVSEEVDSKIREQIANGVFPVRLKPNEWRSGEIHWLLDVIAPNRQATAAVIASFREVIKGREIKLHPLVINMLDEETLKKLGVRRRDGRQARSKDENAGTEASGDKASSVLDQFNFTQAEKKDPH